MFSRYTRLRLRRSMRRQQKSLESASAEAGQHFDKHVLGRWANLQSVRRYVFGWLLLVGLLTAGVYLQGRELRAYYAAEVPVAGGTFREGVVGEVTNMNPIYATSAADRASARLMFSSLLRYDEENNLTTDLAHRWSVSEDGTVYTVVLKEGVTWHDGEPFDSSDVVFTYKIIQHPDSRSYLNASWQNINVQAKDDRTVTFALPNAYTPFPHSLTNGGILPEHILGEVSPAQLRGHPFNVSNPVGTGPFVFEDIAKGPSPVSLLRTSRNDDYHLGRPKLDGFIIQTYFDRDELLQAYENGDLSSAAGMQTDDRQRLLSRSDTTWYDVPLNNAVYVFLKTDEAILDDTEVRLALTNATDQAAIISLLDSRFAQVDGPLLANQLGFDQSLTQFPYRPKKAVERLEEAGWKLKADGIRYKDGTPLRLELVTQNSDDYPEVAQILKEQWRAVGVDLDVLVADEGTIQRNHISTHSYQALLIGVSIGKDPDVFVYWHSSQTGLNGFNLSEYENPAVDVALEAGRTRSDDPIRAAKYASFLKEWRKDAPAIALYQPGFSYVQRNSIDGFDSLRLSNPDDRFTNVHRWRINTVARQIDR